MKERVYHIHALSTLHAGTGQGSGVIDLPIAREIATGLPVVPGSSVKGALRDYHKEYEDNGGNKDNVFNAFGPDTDNAEKYAGAATFGDARLLCLPVRSFYGVFAWVSSPMVLHRYMQDVQGDQESLVLPQILDGKSAIAGTESSVCRSDVAYLEDMDLAVDNTPENCGLIDRWATMLASAVFPDDEEYQNHFKKRFIVVDNDIFSFLYSNAVEITARICIDDEKKTVKGGALWYEEALPVESILWGVSLADKSRYNSYKREKKELTLKNMEEPDQILDYVFDSTITDKPIQLGGKATVGRGRVRLIAKG